MIPTSDPFHTVPPTSNPTVRLRGWRDPLVNRDGFPLKQHKHPRDPLTGSSSETVLRPDLAQINSSGVLRSLANVVMEIMAGGSVPAWCAPEVSTVVVSGSFWRVFRSTSVALCCL
jgi:hypothetical protein